MKEPDITIEEKGQGNQIEVKPTGQGRRETGETVEDLAASIKEFASKIPESISNAVERAMTGRGFPLMVRVDDDILKRIDRLVEAGIFKNRSESAAFLIGEGIKAQATLFERIESKIQEIDRLREELRNSIHQEVTKPSS